MNYLYYLLLAMLVLVFVLIALDWLIRWVRDCREEREMEETQRKSWADAQTDRPMRRYHDQKKRRGMVDNELVITVGVGVFSIGAAVVAGVLVFFFCGLVATWFVVAKQWALTVGNRRYSISSRQMGREGCPNNSWVGRADCGHTPDKHRAPTGCNASAGSETF